MIWNRFRSIVGTEAKLKINIRNVLSPLAGDGTQPSYAQKRTVKRIRFVGHDYSANICALRLCPHFRFCLHDGYVRLLTDSSVTWLSSSFQFESCWYTYPWCKCGGSRPLVVQGGIWWQYLFWHEDGTYRYNEPYLRPFLNLYLITPYSQILVVFIFNFITYESSCFEAKKCC